MRLIKKLLLHTLRTVMPPARYARLIGVKIGGGRCSRNVEWGSEPYLICIGNNCTVTSGVTFITHDGSACLARDERGRRYYYAPIRVGDDVFIGMNSILLPGVELGNRVVVGAGSVVTRSVPDGCVVAGVPARIIGRTDDYLERCLAHYVATQDFPSGKPTKQAILKALSPPKEKLSI